jgi:hypothetical protein
MRQKKSISQSIPSKNINLKAGISSDYNSLHSRRIEEPTYDKKITTSSHLPKQMESFNLLSFQEFCDKNLVLFSSSSKYFPSSFISVLQPFPFSFSSFFFNSIYSSSDHHKLSVRLLLRIIGVLCFGCLIYIFIFILNFIIC